MCQDGCLGKGCFEGFKHLGVIGAPGKLGVLAGEMNERYNDVREPHNESVIEVGKPKNAWTALRFIGVGQMLTVSVLLCPWRCSGGDHEAQEFNPLHVEQALLGFGVQVVLMKVFQDALHVDPMIFQ